MGSFQTRRGQKKIITPDSRLNRKSGHKQRFRRLTSGAQAFRSSHPRILPHQLRLPPQQIVVCGNQRRLVLQGRGQDATVDRVMAQVFQFAWRGADAAIQRDFPDPGLKQFGAQLGRRQGQHDTSAPREQGRFPDTEALTATWPARQASSIRRRATGPSAGSSRSIQSRVCVSRTITPAPSIRRHPGVR